jgi:hypothetical protein
VPQPDRVLQEGAAELVGQRRTDLAHDPVVPVTVAAPRRDEHVDRGAVGQQRPQVRLDRVADLAQTAVGVPEHRDR